MYSEWCLLKLNEQGSQDWSQWMINELISWIGLTGLKRQASLIPLASDNKQPDEWSMNSDVEWSKN